MAKRSRNIFTSPSLGRTLTALTRTAMRAGTKAMKQTLRAQAGASKRSPAKRLPAPSPNWRMGLAVGATGARRYWLFKPPGVRYTERLPLLVMLHGCGQDAPTMAAITQMNRIAARERFLVLYPEQDRLSNVQGCWNWYDMRSGRAQGEADLITAAIRQVCLAQPVDPARVALAGLSAGASMAALLATREPLRFRAIAMHSGIAPGVAHSSATALSAMRGGRAVHVPLAPLPAGVHLPALLVIQGSADRLVTPGNGALAVQKWAAREGAQAGKARTVQRGARYAATVTDYRNRGRLVATLCEVHGLGHAWSGGAANWTYSDPQGPDASRMIWAFVARQFGQGTEGPHP